MGSREIRFCLFPIILRRIALTLACLISAAPSIVLAQPGQTDLEQRVRSLVWQQGPTQVLMGDVAQLQVPLGYKFTGTPGASRMMSAMGNQPSATLIGMLVANDGRFVMSFDFDPIGHVPDDERHQLDASRILASIQQGTEEANAWRRQNGHAELTVTGWLVPPYYDETTHNLVWAIRGTSSDGTSLVNLDTRVLRRRGVLKVKTITDPNSFDAVTPLARRLASGIQFRAGERYSEVRPGDKMATYGLIGLISGGGTTAALKMGLFQKFGKLILLALAALGGAGAWIWNTLHPSQSPPGTSPNSLKRR
ncbi:MAG TPA: DUF2167 domain-containing protein [Planctomicrobium sp.]|nr:DUF2167 domain-containing protein [Planctomicrobium sp.]